MALGHLWNRAHSEPTLQHDMGQSVWHHRNVNHHESVRISANGSYNLLASNFVRIQFFLLTVALNSPHEAEYPPTTRIPVIEFDCVSAASLKIGTGKRGITLTASAWQLQLQLDNTNRLLGIK